MTQDNEQLLGDKLERTLGCLALDKNLICLEEKSQEARRMRTDYER